MQQYGMLMYCGSSTPCSTVLLILLHPVSLGSAIATTARCTLCCSRHIKNTRF